MKQIGFGSLLILWAIPASAGVLLGDRFNYPNGPLSQTAGSPWVTHGGTAQQLQVLDGVLHLSQTDSEDVHADLPGGPYDHGALYASFVVNVEGLPSGDGGFFFHFKDGGSTQKARVFITTNGVAPGRFKFGIANGSTAASYVEQQLLPTTSHRLVVRYQAGSPTTSTLWVDPVSESDTQRRAEASDANRSASINSVAWRQSLASGDGMGSLLVDDLLVGTEFGDVAGLNTPPTISAIGDQEVGANQAAGPIPFHVEDAETESSQLRVSVSSSNPALLSSQGVAFQGTGADRTVRLLPIPDAQGTADVTLSVSDGAKSSSVTFRLTVGAPTLKGPARLEMPMNAEARPLEFLVTDRESQPEQLVLTARSSNAKLFPPEALVWTGRASSRSLSLKPAADQSGVSVITVTLSDGTHTRSHALEVTVYPDYGAVLTDDFSGADGSLIQPAGLWNIHAPDGGSPTNILRQAGHLRLSETKAEDVHALLKEAPYAEASGTILYVALAVRCLELPSAAGSFFGHFRDDRSAFRGRLYLATKESPTGRFRFGVASGAEAPVFLPHDVSVGEDVVLVLKHNLSTGRTQLWIDPTTEADPSVLAAEEASPIATSNWSFRQAAGMGELWVDSLRVATSFSAALGQAPMPRLEFAPSAQGLRLSWPVTLGILLERRERWGVGDWSTVLEVPQVIGDQQVISVPMSGGQAYYRLRNR